MNDFREVFLASGFLCPWRDNELDQDEVDRLQFVADLGVPFLRAVMACYALGISPLRIDQHDQILKINDLVRVGHERLAAAFGYLDGRHVLEGPVTDPPTTLHPGTLRAITLWRIVVGDKVVPINARMPAHVKELYLDGRLH